MSFLSYKDVNAVTMSAVPQQPVFGPNDWIKINLSIKEYSGGPITWVAHRPNSSDISGQIHDIGMGTMVHQIIRDAYDNSFGMWSIDYMYNGIKDTVQFKVNPIILTVFTDKELYYEPDKMQINITTSYYVPNANLAQSYHLNFFDKKGNPAKEIPQTDISILEPSIVYEFPLLKFAKYNPSGSYKLKVQYYNTTTEKSFLLGDISKLMEVRAQTNLSAYNQSDNVILDLVFTRVKESSGTLKITDPSGNITNSQFHVESVHTSLVLRDVTEKVGTYKFEVQYAGATKTGSFNVAPRTQKIPDIDLEILLDKQNYMRDEIIHAKIHTSEIIANSIDIWVADPNGTQYSQLTMRMVSKVMILPLKIVKNYATVTWKFYVNYRGVIRSASFYVTGAQADNREMLDTKKFVIPTFSTKLSYANLSEPVGIAIDSDDNAYVVDSGHARVVRFYPNGTFALSWGGEGSLNGQFKHPTGIFLNKNYVFVADSGNARIQMFDKNGNFLNAWGIYGIGPSMFHVPIALASDQIGDLFVVDSDRNTIQIFGIGGVYKYQIQSPIAKYSSFSAIKAIAFDSGDDFYAVSSDDRILKYSSIGNFINFAGSSGVEDGRFSNPAAIAVDSKDNFYVADSGNHRIQKFDNYGNFVLSWGSEGIGPGQFENPSALAIDSMGNIYVADEKNNNVQKFSYAESNKIATPTWVKDTALWWSVGISNKTDFAQGIRFMIRQGLIQAPLATEINAVKVPEWLKSNARWWYSGDIDDSTFAMSIQYLLKSGIVKV